MKRLLNVLFILMIIFIVLTGCSSNQTSSSQKSEEELKAEIKAEMEAEEKLKAELEAEIRAEIEEEQKPQEETTGTTKSESSAKNDLSKGYTYKVDNGQLKLTYTNTGNTITLVAPGEGSTITRSINRIISASRSHNGRRLYFDALASNGSNGIYYVEIQNFEVKYFTEGLFVKNVGEYPYTNSIIINRPTASRNNYFAYSSAGEELCALGNKLESDLLQQIMIEVELQYSDVNTGGKYNLKGLTNENIHGTQVNYDQYVGVIIPWYKGVNKDSLTPHRWDIGPETVTDLTFAVFGKMENIVISFYEGWESEPISIEAGTVDNAMMTIKTYLSNDMSYIRITGIVRSGEGYENQIDFTLDQMRDYDQYEPIMISY